MDMETINDLQSFAQLLKGLAVVSDVYHYNKGNDHLTEEENDAGEYFLLEMQKTLVDQLKNCTDVLK